MKEIFLPTGHVAIIDDEDYERVASHKWSVLDNHGVGVYAKTNMKISSSPRIYRSMYMHRFILGAEQGQIVDHINRNGLDNRKGNLRFATRSTNAANSKRRNKYRGVYQNGSKYLAQIRVDGKLIHYGTYDCQKEAALVYDYAAEHHFGGFAVKNNPFEDDRRVLL